MDFENIRNKLKNNLPKYEVTVDKMIDDFEFFLNILGGSSFYNKLYNFSENEIAGGLATLVIAANEGKVDFEFAEKNFSVDKDSLIKAYNYLNASLNVSYPDKRYTSNYENLNLDETLLFFRFLTPGQRLWQDFVEYARKKSQRKNLSKLIEGKRGKKLLIEFLHQRKYPQWIKEEIRRWRKEKIYGLFLVNDVKEGMVELFDMPSVQYSYSVITSDTWKSLKPGDQIITLILPWKSHYFLGDKVEVIHYQYRDFLIPPELEVKDPNTEIVPILFSAQTFSDMISGDLEPIYRYILSVTVPTIVAYKPIAEVKDFLIIEKMMKSKDDNEVMKFFGDVWEDVDKILEKAILNEDFREIGIGMGITVFLMYLSFLLFATDLFDTDLLSFIFDMKVINYNVDDYGYYMDKINKKFRDEERDIAVVLLYLLALRYSDGKVLRREDWEKSYESITQDKINEIKKEIEYLRKNLNLNNILRSLKD